MTLLELFEKAHKKGANLKDDLQVFWFTPHNDSLWLKIEDIDVYHNSGECSIVLRLRREAEVGCNCSIPKAEALLLTGVGVG